jgi:hypothetical protein
MHLMELLGDVGKVESRLDPFGNGVSVGARQVHGLRQTYYRLENHFGHPMLFLGDMGHVESHFGLFGHGISVRER